MIALNLALILTRYNNSTSLLKMKNEVFSTYRDINLNYEGLQVDHQVPVT